MKTADRALALYEGVRPVGGKYFHELPEREQRMWITLARDVQILETDLQNTINDRVKLRKKLDDTTKAVREIKGKPPGWYHTMETDWATENFNFPAEPQKTSRTYSHRRIEMEIPVVYGMVGPGGVCGGGGGTLIVAGCGFA